MNKYFQILKLTIAMSVAFLLIDWKLALWEIDAYHCSLLKWKFDKWDSSDSKYLCY